MDTIQLEKGVSNAYNFGLVDIFSIAIFITLLTLGFAFGKKYYSEKGILFPISGIIFLSTLTLVVTGLIGENINSSPSIFIGFMSLIAFSLVCADSRIYSLSKLESMIYRKFRELSYGDFFITKEDIIMFLIKKSELKTNFEFILNTSLLLLIGLTLFGLYINFEDNVLQVYIYCIFVAYFYYFALTIIMQKLIDREQLIFENKLNKLLNNKGSQKLLKEEIEYGPTYYIDNKKDIMLLIDGNYGAIAYFSQDIGTMDKKYVELLLERANGKGKGLHINGV